MLRRSPIIIMGAPRSGTTYVQEIIDTSPQTILTNESRIFSWMFKIMRAEEEDPFVPFRMRHEFINHIRRSRSNFIRDFYGSLDPKARFWGDKNPTMQKIPTYFRLLRRCTRRPTSCILFGMAEML